MCLDNICSTGVIGARSGFSKMVISTSSTFIFFVGDIKLLFYKYT